MSNQSFYLDSSAKETYQLINQTGVQQCVVPNPTLHNACWDAILSSEGQLYLSLCSELTTSEYAKLASYSYEKNQITELYYTKDYIFPNLRAIRDSKIHTSMSWMNDGRMVMLTHTTDKSPEHPFWMPLAHYNDPWTGYPGSSLLTYDPKTNTTENWGIPVQRESLYGGVYDKIKNVYYCIGFIKGHLYGIDLTTRAVKDYGQVAERASYRLIVGSDDNVYFTTRNGILQRVNVRTQKVENLRIQLPYQVEPGRFRPYMSYGINGPDGKLYLTGMHDMSLCCYDPATNEFSVLGQCLTADVFIKGVETKNYISCMAFDKHNVLYYVICAQRKDRGEDYRVPAMLLRWDLFNQKEPEVLGVLGDKARMTNTTCSMLMDTKRDILYITGTNHATDGPHVTAIDLAKYRDVAHIAGPVTEDPFAYPNNGCYDEAEKMNRLGQTIMAENPTAFTAFGKAVPVPLWMEFTDEETEESSVAKLSWKDGNLVAVCGKTKFTAFTISPKGEILAKEPCQAPEAKEAPVCDPAKLPCYPGRQFNRVAALAVPLAGDRKLVATADGMLAVQSAERVFSLGPACLRGPVRDMTVTKDGTKVYGVAGDKDDMGNVFSYSDDEGLCWLGIAASNEHIYGDYSSPLLSAIALNSDDSILAVGSGSRMGCVYLYLK